MVRWVLDNKLETILKDTVVTYRVTTPTFACSPVENLNTSGVPADIRTEYLPNKILESRPSSNLSGVL
jgi:hypothetical protein